MTDLRDRFGELDRIVLPDLDEELRRPRLQRGAEGRRGGRLFTAVVALAVAGAAVAFAVRAFEIEGRAPRPASTVANGQLAFSGGGQIHVVSPDGSGLRQLTHLGGHDALDVHWSPDGSRLAFRVWTNGNYQLYVTNADGTDPTNITGSMGVVHFAWSPDGTMLALTSSQDGNDYDVFVVNADGTGLRSKVESPLGEYGPQWSPEGTRIAFERWPLRDGDPETPDIFVLDLVGGGTVPIVTSPGWDTSVAWSPDGTRIAFTSDRGGDDEIYVVNADGSGERQLTDLPDASAIRPAWSPDGTRLSFVAHDGEQWDVWVVNADGSGLLKLTPRDRDEGPAVWAPDGSMLAFTASDITADVVNTGTYDVYLIRPDGTDERRITFDQVAMGWDLSWQPLLESAPPATVSPSSTETPSATTPLNPHVTATIPIGAFPRAVAVGEGAVWARVAMTDGGPDDYVIAKIDPATNEIVEAIPVPEAGDIAVGAGAVWVASSQDGQGVVLRIDAVTNDIGATIPVGSYLSSVAFGFGDVWVARGTDRDPSADEVIRIDPATNQVVARIAVIGGEARDVVVGEGSVWVYGHSRRTGDSWEASSLWQIDPVTDEVVATVLDENGFLGGGSFLPDNVAVGEGWVWAADDRANGVRIDPSTRAFTTFRVPDGFNWPYAVYQGHVFFGLGTIEILDAETLEVIGSVALDS